MLLAFISIVCASIPHSCQIPPPHTHMRPTVYSPTPCTLIRRSARFATRTLPPLVIQPPPAPQCHHIHRALPQMQRSISSVPLCACVYHNLSTKSPNSCILNRHPRPSPSIQAPFRALVDAAPCVYEYVSTEENAPESYTLVISLRNGTSCSLPACFAATASIELPPPAGDPRSLRSCFENEWAALVRYE